MAPRRRGGGRPRRPGHPSGRGGAGGSAAARRPGRSRGWAHLTGAAHDGAPSRAARPRARSRCRSRSVLATRSTSRRSRPAPQRTSAATSATSATNVALAGSGRAQRASCDRPSGAIPNHASRAATLRPVWRRKAATAEAILMRSPSRARAVRQPCAGSDSWISSVLAGSGVTVGRVDRPPVAARPRWAPVRGGDANRGAGARWDGAGRHGPPVPGSRSSPARSRVRVNVTVGWAARVSTATTCHPAPLQTWLWPVRSAGLVHQVRVYATRDSGLPNTASTCASVSVTLAAGWPPR